MTEHDGVVRKPDGSEQMNELLTLITLNNHYM